jgi:hypothetical protein
MRMSFGGIPVYGRDLYVDGEGRLQIRPLELFTVQDSRGPELDKAELVTYLNDAIIMAPSMLLGPQASFREVDARAFDVTLTDRGHVVSARVTLGDGGAPLEFATDDRSWTSPGGASVPTRWTTPIDGWQLVGDRRLPTSARAVWHFPEGPFAYGEFRFGADTVVFNVAPGT